MLPKGHPPLSRIPCGLQFIQKPTAGTESAGNLQRDGSVAVDALSRWIDSQGRPRFFAFLHLYEPHTPYAPPERHRNHALLYDGEFPDAARTREITQQLEAGRGLTDAQVKLARDAATLTHPMFALQAAVTALAPKTCIGLLGWKVRSTGVSENGLRSSTWSWTFGM